MGAATLGDFGTSEAEWRGTETQFSQFTTQHLEAEGQLCAYASKG
jgi:hypothetical protein